MSSLFDIHDWGQIATLIGIPTLLVTIFIQIRSYKKEQKEMAERNRLSITHEINDKTQILFERIEARLEAIKIAAIITKDDITLLKTQVTDLRRYVDDLDKSGTAEWQKTKPFIMEKIADIDKRIGELNNRFSYKMTEIAKDEIKKDRNRLKIRKEEWEKEEDES